MAQEYDNIFFCNREAEDFHTIILNYDLEELLGVNSNKKRNEIIVPTKVPKLSVTKIVNIVIPPFGAQNNVPPTREKIKKITNKISRIHYGNQYKYFQNTLQRNEKFVSKFINDNPRHKILNIYMLDNLNIFMASRSPLNRFSWSIICKLNIYDRRYPQQYIKVDGREILLCGNIGGKMRSIKFDSTVTTPRKENKVKITKIKNNAASNIKPPCKRRLLTSLNGSFKPGPLSKKPKLKRSYPEMGPDAVQQVKLPSIGLEIFPLIGRPLNAQICNHLKRVRNPEGYIDATWANFASSTIVNNSSKNNQPSHTFVIPYENNRSHILMGKDIDVSLKRHASKQVNNHHSVSDLNGKLSYLDNYKPKNNIEKVVSSVVLNLLNAVCISEIQDIIGKQETPDCPEVKPIPFPETKTTKKKCVGRKYVNELKKLNVTVIDIDLNDNDNPKDKCQKDFCKLGCICATLCKNYVIKDHCGLVACMFDCKCNLNEKSASELCRPDEKHKISPTAVVNLQCQMSKNLSKEEKKFQRTVIRSDDQTIMLGAKRRGVRMPKRFEDYCSIDDEILNDKKCHYEVKVMLPKLPSFVADEPWCMVHQLYRCFCKGFDLEGTPHDFSTRIDKEECQQIINDTISLQKKYNVECIRDFPCSRTTHDPLLVKRSLRQRALLLDRNILIGENQNAEMQIQTPTQSVNKPENSSSENQNSNSTQCTNSTFTLKGEHRRNLEIIEKNSILLKYLMTTNASIILQPPKVDDFIAISLCSLISRYLLEQIYVWITFQTPFRQFITLGSTISSSKCINIKYANDSILDMHPPFIKDIIRKKITTDVFVLLVGKSIAWEIAAVIKNAEVKDNQPKVNKPVISKICIKPITPKSQGSPESSQNINSPSEVSTSKPTVSLNRWIMIYVKDDFVEMCIKSKKFAAEQKNILTISEKAQTHNKLFHILAENSLNLNDFKFGIYAFPFSKRKLLFLGPYEENEDSKLEIIGHSPHEEQSVGIWLNDSINAKIDQIVKYFSKPNISEHALDANCVVSKNLQSFFNSLLLRKFFFTDLINFVSTSRNPKILKRRQFNSNNLNSTKCRRVEINANISNDQNELQKPLSSNSDNEDAVIYVPRENLVVEISDSD